MLKERVERERTKGELTPINKISTVNLYQKSYMEQSLAVNDIGTLHSKHVEVSEKIKVISSIPQIVICLESILRQCCVN